MIHLYQMVFYTENSKHSSLVVYTSKDAAEKCASRCVGMLGVRKYKIVELSCYDI